MHVELTDEQAELLRELLDVALHDLNYEVASADLPSYRESLWERRTTVKRCSTWSAHRSPTPSASSRSGGLQPRPTGAQSLPPPTAGRWRTARDGTTTMREPSTEATPSQINE